MANSNQATLIHGPEIEVHANDRLVADQDDQVPLNVFNDHQASDWSLLDIISEPEEEQGSRPKGALYRQERKGAKIAVRRR